MGRLSQILAKGNSGKGSDYTYTDNNPNAGLNMYRLEMVDLDGTIKFSNIISIYSSNVVENKFKVYPNPVRRNQDIQIQFNAISSNKETIQILNINGNILISKTIQVAKGINTYSLNIGNMPSGVYYLVIKDPSSNHYTNSKIIVL